MIVRRGQGRNLQTDSGIPSLTVFCFCALTSEAGFLTCPAHPHHHFRPPGKAVHAITALLPTSQQLSFSEKRWRCGQGLQKIGSSRQIMLHDLFCLVAPAWPGSMKTALMHPARLRASWRCQNMQQQKSFIRSVSLTAAAVCHS